MWHWPLNMVNSKLDICYIRGFASTHMQGPVKTHKLHVECEWPGSSLMSLLKYSYNKILKCLESAIVPNQLYAGEYCVGAYFHMQIFLCFANYLENNTWFSAVLLCMYWRIIHGLYHTFIVVYGHPFSFLYILHQSLVFQMTFVS